MIGIFYHNFSKKRTELLSEDIALVTMNQNNHWPFYMNASQQKVLNICINFAKFIKLFIGVKVGCTRTVPGR
jgi:hypothetical protein